MWILVHGCCTYDTGKSRQLVAFRIPTCLVRTGCRGDVVCGRWGVCASALAVMGHMGAIGGNDSNGKGVALRLTARTSLPRRCSRTRMTTCSTHPAGKEKQEARKRSKCTTDMKADSPTRAVRHNVCRVHLRSVVHHPHASRFRVAVRRMRPSTH